MAGDLDSTPGPFPLDQIVAELRSVRGRWRATQSRVFDSGEREFPSRDVVHDTLVHLKGALFPLRLGPSNLKREGEDYYVGHALDMALPSLEEQVRLELAHRRRRQEGSELGESDLAARSLVNRFARALPGLRATLDSDVKAAFQGDPAARSVDEVLLCYPGVVALIHHRLAHALYNLGAPLIARMIAELAHSETGIDIHPGAKIGGHFFIDHGTGVVIGETAEIGEHVRIYQAVTLGAKRIDSSPDKGDARGEPRHPIVEDHVVIYAGATILGRITIGQGSTIGGNVWLTRSVPPFSQVQQARSTHEGLGESRGNGL